MKHSKFSVRFVWPVLGLGLSVASCFQEPSGAVGSVGGAAGNMSSTTAGTSSLGDAGNAGDGPTCTPRPMQDGAQCHPAQSADPLVGRVVTGAPSSTTLYQSQLFSTMKSYCGGCHLAPTVSGSFSFSEATFAVDVDDRVLKAIQSNTDACTFDATGMKTDSTCFDFMPPASAGGKKWSDRLKDPGDPLQPLARQLGEWLAQGSHDTFTEPPQPGAIAPYSVSADLASALTNLGTCVPDAGMVGTDPGTCEMDARFAALAIDPNGTLPERVGLPATLDQTDLTSFDSAVLARKGVVAYVPAYPLWTDNDGKLRMVRVPVGQSITYNRTTKQFDIPANTRFYKTFMQKVKGADGVTRYHKIETRVIVSRPRDANGVDQSIFGTYEWNDDESQATLLTDPQNDGQPFIDKVEQLTIDEGIAATVQALVKNGTVRNFTYEMDNRHALRRYAFPGRARCMQCHMGSPSQSFVLGFTPLQLNTRPCSPEQIANDGHCDAGQVEPAEGDELTQVERLTSYGVISGYGMGELQKLEDPQGTSKAPRPVRTTEELVAQAYMLGNCSHCHNPNGYPSVLHPELEPLLNFLPSDVGGIFGFPFERYSPRIFRNLAGDGPIAYITPSLRDRWVDPASGSTWVPKVVNLSDGSGFHFIDAPWRSLIYRNVDTPFTYVDDSAIYPHMPLNMPGFDCRAPRIIGEWMVSIPAVAKHPALTEDILPGEAPAQPSSDPTSPHVALLELDPQPYREVKPGDDDYYSGVAQAAQRLAQYRSGVRDGQYCPDTSDIVDITAQRAVQGTPNPPIPTDGEVATLPRESVPDRPDWISVDLTNPPGPWLPRRTDWKQILVNQDYTGVTADAAQKSVVAQLQNVTLSSPAGSSGDFLTFANTQIPFGLWQQTSGCSFNKTDCAHGYCGKLKDYDGSSAAFPHEKWMDNLPASVPVASAPEAPVYSAIPGSLVFNMICVNCHGPDADSGGRQAQTLAEMTGGTARVADFRDGMFGPFGQGTNRAAVFDSDDEAARYLPWMALGGTNIVIPEPILNLVANTPVLGEPRPGGPAAASLSANMLQQAQALCTIIAQQPSLTTNVFGLSGWKDEVNSHSAGYHLLTDNGDAELWVKLCTFNNPAPIHTLLVRSNTNSGVTTRSLFFVADGLYSAQAYPANTAIGDIAGDRQDSLTPDNWSPWCVVVNSDDDRQYVSTLQTNHGSTAHPDVRDVPICPATFITDSNKFHGGANDSNGVYQRGDIDDWAARGAINAGQAVFVYLRQMISQGKGRDLTYNECDKLGK
jgi:mono/diheme cytochrome c family protein